MPNNPTNTRKTTTIQDGLNKGKKIADAVKEFTPPEVDVLIDRGTGLAELANTAKRLFGGLFKRKPKQ